MEVTVPIRTTLKAKVKADVSKTCLARFLRAEVVWQRYEAFHAFPVFEDRSEL